jgi:hypothetical protein
MSCSLAKYSDASVGPCANRTLSLCGDKKNPVIDFQPHRRRLEPGLLARALVPRGLCDPRGFDRGLGGKCPGVENSLREAGRGGSRHHGHFHSAGAIHHGQRVADAGTKSRHSATAGFVADVARRGGAGKMGSANGGWFKSPSRGSPGASRSTSGGGRYCWCTDRLPPRTGCWATSNHPARPRRCSRSRQIRCIEITPLWTQRLALLFPQDEPWMPCISW